MTTEPFEPVPGPGLVGDTAPVAPVTPGMLDHAAHAAAERAEAVAQGAVHETDPGHAPDRAPLAEVAPAQEAPVDEAPAPEAVAAEAPAPEAPAAPAVPEPAAAPIAEARAAAERSIAAEAVSGALRPADLAFNHGSAADERTRESVDRAADSVGRFNAKLVEIAAGNVAAAGELVSALLAAKSVPEAAAINADHLRRRLDTLTMQGRELLILAQRAAFEALRPASGDPRKL